MSKKKLFVSDEDMAKEEAVSAKKKLFVSDAEMEAAQKPTAEESSVSLWQKAKALPGAMLDTGKAAAEYLGRSIQGEIPLSEQLDRAATAARGAGDIIQSTVGLVTDPLVNAITGREQAPAKPTAELLSSLGVANKESMQRSDEMYPGARELGKMVPMAGMPATVPATAASSALYSAAGQKADKGVVNLKDVLDDTALSTGMMGAAKGVSKAVSAAAPKVGEVLSGAPADTLRDYADVRKSGRAVQPITDTAVQAVGAAEAAGKRVSEGSGLAFDILNTESVMVPKADAANIFFKKAYDLRKNSVLTPDMKKDILYFETLGKSLASEPGGSIPGAKIKSMIQGIDKNAYGSAMKAGEITPANERALRAARSELSGELKSRSPAYAEQMKQVSSDVKAQKSLTELFPDREKALANLRSMGRERAPFKAETLKELESSMGADFLQKTKDSMAVDAMKGKSVQGSRNVNLYSNIPVIGPVLGYAADYVSKPAVAKSIDWSSAVSKAIDQSPGMAPFKGALIEAARRGPQYLLLTHQMLMSKDPKYQQAVGGQ